MEIREERQADVAAVREVNRRAFGQKHEANIADALRTNGAALFSFVAVLNGRPAGHVMYSPASVAGVVGAALGPLAVLPEHQRQGIGSALVRTGNRKLTDAGCPFIVVVGDPKYYLRFGFTPASRRGITCEWEVPDDVFMVLVLDEAKMRGVSGQAKYRHEFSSVT